MVLPAWTSTKIISNGRTILHLDTVDNSKISDQMQKEVTRKPKSEKFNLLQSVIESVAIFISYIRVITPKIPPSGNIMHSCVA
jgi:hypothetical protein